MHQYRTWIEISKKNIAHNYAIFRDLLEKKTKLLGVVKSNAYGHELLGFARELERLGVDMLGVDSITEARSLRNHKITKQILVLGYTLPENFGLASAKNISVAISTFENLQQLASHKKNISIHLKFDTGMHRQGFYLHDIPQVLQMLKKNRHIKVDGLFTHFAAAKKPDSSNATEQQIQKFKQVIVAIKNSYPKVIAHASATAGALNYPEAGFDMVRIGIGMYGLWPSEETKNAFSDNLGIESRYSVNNKPIPLLKRRKTFLLKPVLTWKTIISELKTVEKGEKIGYDYTEGVNKTAVLAVLPIGYWHGYWRAFSSKAFVLVKGQRCKVIGRVSMDMVVIDVTDIPKVRVGDEVILIGKQGTQEITADELAKVAGTSNYEIVTRLNPLIKKNYIL